ncbi:MAG: hypothetical protein AAFX04_04515 [Pseudomonadota bacterium]
MSVKSIKIILALSLIAAPLSPAAAQAPQAADAEDRSGRIERALEASAKIISSMKSVEGVYDVHTARSHDGVELIMAWFENRDAVLRWFNHPYHRKLLRDAGRPEDGVAAEHFGDDVGPILIIASVAYHDQPASLKGSMFDDPDGRRPTRFSVEYYVPLPGGAYMSETFAPTAVTANIPGMRDVYDDD